MTKPAHRRRRVPALAPEERRAALIEATLPLLRQYGANVSTRQIADAAGVAEGTIFGVFPDKASLVRAAIVRAMDPHEAIAAIDTIDRSLELRDRLTKATEVLAEQMAENVALMTVLLRSGMFQPQNCEDDHGGDGAKVFRDVPPEIREARELTIDAVVSIIGPDAAQLRKPPGVTGGLLVSLVLLAVRGGFGFPESVSAPSDIVSLLLDGLLSPAGQTAYPTGDSTCS